MKKLAIFDLDGTLAESKSSLTPEMGKTLQSLLGVAKVAVISGGDWAQFEKQLLAGLLAGTDLSNLTLLPTCGTKFFVYQGGWKKLYADDLTPDEKKKIIDALEKAVAESGFKPDQVWGETIEDRDSQITYSALGQQAPISAKKVWDPDFARRQKLKVALDKTIPEFSVRLGGTTSVDVTKPGIDKAYGINKLIEILKIQKAEMIFMGDAIFPGGNDYPVKQVGVDSVQVRDPEETQHVVEAILTR